MACDINVLINGVVEYTAHTDEELDDWIASHQGLLLKGIEVGFNKIYSLDSKAETFNKLDKIKSDYLSGKAKVLSGEFFACGVTPFWNSLWKIVYPESLKDHKVKPTDVGSEADDVLNTIFNGKKPKPRNYVSDDMAQKIKSSWETLIKPYFINRAKIKISDPQNQYKSQFGVQTKSFNDELLNFIQSSDLEFKDERSGIVTKAKDLTHIRGIADLLIVDDDGTVHIIDFKTAENTGVDGQDYLNKHKEYIAQLSTYAAILRQYGIPVGDMYLVVFKTDYLDNELGEHIRLTDINFDKVVRIPNSNPYVAEAEKFFWSAPNIKESTMVEVGNALNNFFPDTPIAARLNARELDYNYMVKYGIHPVNEDHPEYAKGNRFYFVKKKSITGLHKDEYVYGKTKGELINDKINPDGTVTEAPYKQYIAQVNAKKSRRFQDFAKELKYAMSSHNLDDFEATIDSIAPKNNRVLKHHFKRYILGGWKFKENELCNVNGIYLFEKGNRLEIIVVDEEQAINKQYKFNGNTSILGSYIQDSPLTDDRTVMKATYGNMMLMKACALLALDPNLTQGCKVSCIKALNFHSARVFEENNERLINNWNLLSEQYNQNNRGTKPLNKLGYNTFMKDTKALMEICDDYLEMLFLDSGSTSNRAKYKKLMDQRKSDKELTRESLIKLMHMLQRSDDSLKNINTISYDTDAGVAYTYINRALLSLEGINIFQEEDLGSILKGINLAGINMRSFNESKSPLARQMGDLISRFNTGVRLEFIKEQYTWSKLIDAAFKEEGFSEALGNDWSFFDSWFEKTPDGKIDPAFRLVRPEKFTQGPAARKAYEHFLKTNAKYRWPNETDRQEAEGTDEYYEVPLMAGGFTEQLLHGDTVAAIRHKWNRFKDESIDVILGGKEGKNVERTRQEIENIDVDRLDNLLNKDGADRASYIEANGVDYLEKNLDIVFLNILFSGIRTERSPLFCELFTGTLVAVDYMMSLSGLDVQAIRQAMTQFIASKLFLRDIRNPEEEALNGILSIVKSASAKIALGWNTRAFFREILTGQKKHLNRWIAGAENKNAFIKGTKKFFTRPEFLDYSEFVDSYVDVVARIIDNFSVFGFYSQLNSIYGMVEFSGQSMVDSSKVHQWTVLGIGSKSSVTSTAPDFLHRMAILGGHLRTIGAWDAYSQNSEGRVVYNMKADKQYEYWFKYKDSNEISDILERRKFQQAKQHYEEALKSWNEAGYKLNYGDLLPQALSPQETLSLKTYADEMYGNYDDETKSLVQKQTLGSLFFQYKTYGLAQFQLWFSNPGFTNTLTYNYVLDENNERLVEVKSQTQEEYEKYQDSRWIPESQVTEEMWQLPGTRYVKMLGGDLFMGKAQTDYLLASHLFKLSGEEFRELWESNPEYRVNLYLTLLDLLEFALIGLLLRLFWGTDETPIYHQDFIPRWTYGVLQGMSTDGPLIQTLSGIVGDGTPPVFGMVKNYIRTFNSIINGNQNLLYGLTNTLGATRELSNAFRSIIR